MYITKAELKDYLILWLQHNNYFSPKGELKQNETYNKHRKATVEISMSYREERRFGKFYSYLHTEGNRYKGKKHIIYLTCLFKCLTEQELG